MLNSQPSALVAALAQTTATSETIVRRFGSAEYRITLRAMQAFNQTRTSATCDEIWLVEHPPVFTLGLAGKLEHVVNPGSIPVVKSDRGGQVTYHGPGQLVTYLLLDLRRIGFGVKELVRRIEFSVIDLLAGYAIDAHREPGMPGVYVGDNQSKAKISAIGLRVARHATYHGLALNVDMDLEPFSRINPCGYPGLKSAQMKDFGVSASMQSIGDHLVSHLIKYLR